jgi:OmpA-OmpF porin, OOP family
LKESTVQSGIPITVFWLLAIWVVLVLAALVWGIDNAESQLRFETRSVLSQSGRDFGFDVSGRDVTLFGAISSEEEGLELAAAIDAIPGVRQVRNGFSIVEPVAPEPAAPSVSMQIIGDAISLRGLVPSQEIADALVTAASEQYGENRVVAGITVNENAETRPWLGKVKDVFEYLSELRSGGFVADDESFILSGEVISESVRTRVEQDLALVFDDTLSITSNLEIAVLPTPTFHAERADGVVTLQGSVPDEDTAARIIDAVRRLHAGSTIINDLRVGEVAGPAWLDSIGGLLDVVTRLDPWTLDISGGQVTITGLTLDADFVAAIDVLTEEVVAGQLTVSTDIQLDPAAVTIELTNLVAGTDLFEPDTANLTAAGRALLDQAIDILGVTPSTNLIVAGHTDDRGAEADNLALSQQQAEAVVAYLVAGGVDPGRLTAVGYGETLPIADNVTEDGRAQNRRIEFVLEGDG